MTFGALILLFLGGCLGGLMAGLLGIGGGLVFVLIFTNYLSAVNAPETTLAHYIVANSMFAIFFAGISGSVKHYFNNNFYFKPVLISGIAASVTSLITSYLINTGTWYSKEVFSVIFISITSYVAYRILMGKDKDDQSDRVEGFSLGIFLIIGGLGGILAALSGVGGGVIMVPLLTRLLHINIKKATAISLGVITIMALVSSVYALFTAAGERVQIPHAYGLIILPMVLPVAAGCIICSPFGVTLAKRIPVQVIKVIFASFLLLVIFNMIYNLWL
ncbi:MAG TPA: sulfite exporter TauE/SafE family protein [Sphingobacteriaceae bacterium]